MAVCALVHLASFVSVHVLTYVFLAFVLIGALNIAAEDGGASSEVVDVLEANTRINCIEVFAAQGIVHAGGGFASLVAGRYKGWQSSATNLPSASLPPKLTVFAAGEDNRSNCIAFGPGCFVMAGGAQEAIAGRHGD